MEDVTIRPPGRTIVGRRGQLAELERLWALARSGQAVGVLVGGEAGIGKTTLIDTFCDSRHDARVVRGQCVPLGGDGLAYVPIVAILRDLEAHVGRDRQIDWAGPGVASLQALRPEITGPAGPLAPGPSDRTRTLEVVTEILEHASKDHPLVVVVEDLHWSDTSTRDLLGFALRALDDAPVLLVATYRTDELHRRHPLRPFLAELDRLPRVCRLDVPRLDRTGVAAMVAAIDPVEEADAGRVDDIFRRSDGIPFYVEELAASGTSCLPGPLRDVLLIRFEALSPQAQNTVRLLAAAGSRTEHALLELVSDLGPNELGAAVREAVDAHLIVADSSGYAFRHSLLREAVLEDLLPGEAASLHRSLAETLELKAEILDEPTRAVRLAHHWNASHQPHRAFHWSVTAARLVSVGKSEALALFERALELWPQVDDPDVVAGVSHAALVEETAMMAVDAGELTRALALVDLALGEIDRTADPATAARLLGSKGRLLSNLMRFGSAELLEEATSLVPADPPTALRADLLAVHAAMVMVSGDDEAAIRIALEAIDVAQAAGAPAEEASARITLGTSLGALGRLDDALAEFATARRLDGDNDRTLARLLINLSDVLRLNGKLREAVATATEGVAISRTLGLERTWGAMLGGNAAEALLATGEWAEAIRIIDRGLAVDPTTQHRLHLRLLKARYHIGVGDLAAADHLLAEFRPQLAGPHPNPQYLTVIAAAEAEYGLASGDPARAWNAVARAHAAGAALKASAVWWIYVLGAAAVAQARRDPSTARGFDADAAAAWLREWAATIHHGVTNAAAAALIDAELSDDPAAWETAHAALRREEGPAVMVPYAALRRAELIAATDRTTAIELAGRATDDARRIGATPLADRAEALLRRLGAGEVPDDAPASVPGAPALTPRELDVLRLVADGRSNGEIGKELFISPKTASVHVSNILAKLGVARRTEAAAVAHRHGLLG